MRGMQFTKPPSTRATKRHPPMKRRPGTPKAHLSNLQRAYLKRKVLEVMPEYFEVQDAQRVLRGENNVLRGAIIDILYEASKGDTGDLPGALARARDLVATAPTPEPE